MIFRNDEVKPITKKLTLPAELNYQDTLIQQSPTLIKQSYNSKLTDHDLLKYLDLFKP